MNLGCEGLGAGENLRILYCRYVTIEKAQVLKLSYKILLDR